MGRLTGKSAIITGAASGIGRATAELFAREGARVLALDINPIPEGLNTESSNEGRILTMVGDAADQQTIENAVEEVRSKFGQLDIFFANAGIQGKRANLWNQSVAEVNEVLRVNLVSVFIAIKCASLSMARTGGGSIICTSSIAGLAAYGMVPYSIAKAGVVALVKNAAHEFAGLNIRVNGIAPGVIESGMNKPLFDTWRETGKAPPLFKANPLERPGSALELAQAALFLASAESSYVNGHTIPVDGGWIARANLPEGGSPWRCQLPEDE
jgi:NAD(P)-dependent dehydrogenase (short-subunit alcohol dehydrogenase family)